MTISAQILADSINQYGNRLTTFQLRYPRFIHAEFMTHRTISRNASSSRAIPVEKLIEDVMTDTAIPTHWGKNQKGMQAGEEWNAPVIMNTRLSDVRDAGSREAAWLFARDNAVRVAQGFHEAGYHKQIVNRLLEPFSHINVVATATEWANFFHLRDHSDAEPHIHDLAFEMRAQLKGSTPTELHRMDWHLPYVTDDDWNEYPADLIVGGDGYSYEEALEGCIKVSVARCARVSYLTREGRKSWHNEDRELYDRLVGSQPLHASPTEHQAYADQRGTDGAWVNAGLHGNLVGFVQYRKTLPGENYTGPID